MPRPGKEGSIRALMLAPITTRKHQAASKKHPRESKRGSTSEEQAICCPKVCRHLQKQGFWKISPPPPTALPRVLVIPTTAYTEDQLSDQRDNVRRLPGPGLRAPADTHSCFSRALGRSSTKTIGASSTFSEWAWKRPLLAFALCTARGSTLCGWRGTDGIRSVAFLSGGFACAAEIDALLHSQPVGHAYTSTLRRSVHKEGRQSTHKARRCSLDSEIVLPVHESNACPASETNGERPIR